MLQRYLAPPPLREILLSITELAPFSTVARRLAEAVMHLTSADFAALGAYDDRLRLDHFEAAGLTAAEGSALEHPPARHRHPKRVRVQSGHDQRARAVAGPAGSGGAARPPGDRGLPRRARASTPHSRSARSTWAAGPVARPSPARSSVGWRDLAPHAAIALANARTLEAEHRRALAAEALAEAAHDLQQLTPERQTGEVLASSA